MTIELAYCAWGLSGQEEEILDYIAGAGISWVDVRVSDFANRASQDHMRNLGLQISCLGASFFMPPGSSLDSADRSARHGAVQHAKSGILRAGQAGLHHAYVVPGQDSSKEGLERYTDSLSQLADFASVHDVRVSIEHFPNTALPTIADTLAYLRRLGHPNLSLLLDIGHAQMTNENVPAAIAEAGSLLGYVHLDDNDGLNDQHLALYDGELTEPSLRAIFAALERHGYSGRASLELHPQLPDPLDALTRSRSAALAAMDPA